MPRWAVRCMSIHTKATMLMVMLSMYTVCRAVIIGVCTHIHTPWFFLRHAIQGLSSETRAGNYFGQRRHAMTGPAAADLLSTSAREREAPHVLTALLQQLSTCPALQQQPLTETQGVEVLVHLIQHKEPSVQLEACLALTCVELPEEWHQSNNIEPLAAALADAFCTNKQPARTTRSSSTSSRHGNRPKRPGSSSSSRSKTSTTPVAGHSTPAVPACSPDIPHLAAAAVTRCAASGVLEEVCRLRPALLSTLPQLLVDTVERALHDQVAQQQAAAAWQLSSEPQQQQQPWQLPAARAALGGLLQLLCCSSQRVHCAVVAQLCRLAYCTCVLEQLGVGLAAYPGAVAAVTALVQPWSPEDFAATSDSSSQANVRWPGRAPQLQAEAAASLLVLSSLGSGARELAAQEANAVRGLLLALSGQPWQTQWQQQVGVGAARLQVCEWFSLPYANIKQLAAGVLFGAFGYITCCFKLAAFCCRLPSMRCWGAVQRAWVENWGPTIKEFREYVSAQGSCSRVFAMVRFWWGVCCELVAWVVGLPVAVLVELGILRVLWVLCTMLLPGRPKQQWVGLRQQWAAYCLWHLVSSDGAGRRMLQYHRELAAGVMSPFVRPTAHVCPCTVMFACDLAIQAGLSFRSRLPAGVLRCIEPPPPPFFPSTWRYHLEQWALVILHHAWANIKGVAVYATVLGVCLMLAGGFAGGLAQEQLLPTWADRAWVVLFIGSCLCVIPTAGVCLTGLLVSAAAAAGALVVTASSQLGSYQVVVATRPAPAAAPPRTWLQPVTYLSLDLSYALSQEAAGSRSLVKYSQFGQWPAVAPFQPTPCAAQGVCAAGVGWLGTLHCTGRTYAVLSLLAYVLLWRQDSGRALCDLLMADSGGEALQWVCGVCATSLRVACVCLWVSAAVLGLCCAVLQPSWSSVRWVLAHCWWAVGALYASAAGLVPGSAALVACTCGRVGSAVLWLLCAPWYLIRACLCAAAYAVVCVALGAVRVVVWLLWLPLRLVSASWRLMSAAGRLVSRAWAAAAPASVCSNHAVAQLRPKASARGSTTTAASSAAAAGHQGEVGEQTGSEHHVQAAAAAAAAAAAWKSKKPGAIPPGAAAGSMTNIRSKARRGKENQTMSPHVQGDMGASTAAGGATGQGKQLSSGNTSIRGQQVDRFPAAATPCVVPSISSSSMGATAPGVRAGPTGSGPGSGQDPPPSRDPSGPAAYVEVGAASGRVHMPSSTQEPGPLSSSTRFNEQAPTTGSSSSSSNSKHARAAVMASSSGSGERLRPPEHAAARQQQQAALAAAQPAAHEAARTAAAAAVAAGLPADEVHLAAAHAAAEALQGAAPGLPFVAGSMLVVRAAAAAAAVACLPMKRPTSSATADVLAPAAEAAGSSAMVTAGPSGPAPWPAAVGDPPKAGRKRKEECVVCLDARPCVTTHPCGHRVLCGGCALLVAVGKGECPMCRAAVVRYEAGPGRG